MRTRDAGGKHSGWPWDCQLAIADSRFARLAICAFVEEEVFGSQKNWQLAITNWQSSTISLECNLCDFPTFGSFSGIH